MSDRDPTIKKRAAKLAAGNRGRGLVQVKPWIPKHRRQELLDIAALMRKEHKEGK